MDYDSYANTDDGSCEAVVLGCTDGTAFNLMKMLIYMMALVYPVEI